jgi:hypothetical protein
MNFPIRGIDAPFSHGDTVQSDRRASQLMRRFILGSRLINRVCPLHPALLRRDFK